MGAYGGFSVEGFHWMLWTDRSKRDTVRVSQIKMAERLQISRHLLNRIMKAMCEEGRLKQLSKKASRAGHLYLVMDPADFAEDPDAYRDAY